MWEFFPLDVIFNFAVLAHFLLHILFRFVNIYFAIFLEMVYLVNWLASIGPTQRYNPPENQDQSHFLIFAFF